jgi:hypothetical protein
MKRRSSRASSDRSHGPKKRLKFSHKLCIICKTQEPNLHRITEDEAEILSIQYDLQIVANQRACCRHWVPHHKEIFKKNSRPPLLKDTNTYHSSPLQRIPPTRIPYTKPEKPIQELRQKDLLRILKKKEEYELELKAKIEELESELYNMKNRPYEIIFKICEEKSEEGTKQLLGIHIRINYYILTY